MSVFILVTLISIYFIMLCLLGKRIFDNTTKWKCIDKCIKRKTVLMIAITMIITAGCLLWLHSDIYIYIYIYIYILAALVISYIWSISKITYKRVFICLISAGIITFWITIICSPETAFEMKKYFVPGALDDFFTPMMKTMDNTYVEPHYSDYPALPNLIYQFFRRFISDEELLTAAGMESSRVASRWLATTMGGKFLPVFFYVITYLFMYAILENYINKSERKIENNIVLILILMSGPFVFILERGNNIILSILFIVLFLLYYDSENVFLKELALISLAIATAIKIYPVFFGVLLLKKDNKKIIVRTIIYGILIFFGFFFLYDGFDSITAFFENLRMRNEAKESTLWGYNYSISFLASYRIFSNVFTGTYQMVVSKAILIIPLLVCIYIFLFNEDKWKKIMSICLFVMWFPSASYTYLLAYMVVPLIMLLNRDEMNIFNTIYCVCFSLMYTPFCLPRLEGFFAEALPEVQFTVGMFIVHLSIFIIVITLIIETTRGLLEKKKTENV